MLSIFFFAFITRVGHNFKFTDFLIIQMICICRTTIMTAYVYFPEGEKTISNNSISCIGLKKIRHLKKDKQR